MNDPILYTDPALVTAVRITEAPLSTSATGYGPKIPTRYMIRYGAHWKRVYVMIYGNAGSAYIVHRHEDLHLDTDTEHTLKERAA